MGAALAKTNLFRGCERMPIKLKDVLHKAGLSISDLAGGVAQSTGRPMSRTALSLLINWKVAGRRAEKASALPMS